MELLKQMNIDPKVIAASITGFILLWITLKKFLFAPILGLLVAREAEIRSTYDAAGEERSKAEQLRADYEQRLAGVEAESRAMVQAAVRDAENVKNEILSEAKERASGIVQRGQEDLAREREKTLVQIREEVVNISLAAAGKLIGESLDDKKHRNLVSDFIDKVGAAQ